MMKYLTVLCLMILCVTLDAQDSYDVYLCIGQSNMAGRGYLQESDVETSLDGIYLLDESGAPVAATHPFNQYSTIRKDIKMQQMHLGYSFAQSMYEESGRPILLVCNARGGTSITQWGKGSHYYNEAVERTKQAMKYGQLKGVIWHQGCGDASKRSHSYMHMLKDMVEGLRADLGNEKLPFIAGEIPYWFQPSHEFNEMIRTISVNIPYTSFVSAEDCGMRADPSDPHFSREGLLILGERYAQEMKMLLCETSRWTKNRIEEWCSRYGWISGCNYIPCNAINQLEMWDRKTFDPQRIDKELGWAAELGFNCMRVFLHHLAWEVDKEGFKNRIRKYLEISSSHGIHTMFVFLDDCWNESYFPGKQPKPIRGTHNSGWVKDPGSLYYGSNTGESEKVDKDAVEELLKTYVHDILTTFKDDDRIFAWDLYNEPGGGQGKYRYYERSFPLLKKIFSWAREINPSQPLTAGVWNKRLGEMNVWQLNNSDFVTYHTYEPAPKHQHMVDTLKKYNRPMICTEYMARTQGSTFQTIMPMLKKEGVGAINWGFVAGKTNTIFAWATPVDADEPEVWFHDILRKNGTPYSEDEVRCIKMTTGKDRGTHE